MFTSTGSKIEWPEVLPVNLSPSRAADVNIMQRIYISKQGNMLTLRAVKDL